MYLARDAVGNVCFSDQFFQACELTDYQIVLVLTAPCFKIQSTFEDAVYILASKETVLRSRLYFRNVLNRIRRIWGRSCIRDHFGLCIQLFRERLSEKCARDNPERQYGI